ncbi:helix-turn-helix domain-containing protein [Haladaptatus sp. CMAA 1911]|uniref:helix-turn-helix domain-containing protein n=1 Tax=unclassified Haladaptatus TaxID=2622732 RepID=UPI003754C408
MVTVRLEITPPRREWFARLSTECPDDEFTLLTVTSARDGQFGVFEVETDDLPAVRSTLDGIEEITSYEVVHADERIAVVQYTTTESIVHRATVDAGVVPVCPVTVVDGKMVAEATVSHEHLSRLGDSLRDVGATFEVLSLTQSFDGDEGVLTDSQRKFVVKAVERGYYDTPRRCTLTQLAAELGITTGAASGMAHRTEERIIKGFVSEALP